MGKKSHAAGSMGLCQHRPRVVRRAGRPIGRNAQSQKVPAGGAQFVASDHRELGRIVEGRWVISNIVVGNCQEGEIGVARRGDDLRQRAAAVTCRSVYMDNAQPLSWCGNSHRIAGQVHEKSVKQDGAKRKQRPH